jgi:hypothetical protein
MPICRDFKPSDGLDAAALSVTQGLLPALRRTRSTLPRSNRGPAACRRPENAKSCEPEGPQDLTTRLSHRRPIVSSRRGPPLPTLS